MRYPDRLARALLYAGAISRHKGRVARTKAKHGPCAGYVFELDGRAKVGISQHPEIRASELSLAAGKLVFTRQLVWFDDRTAALVWEKAAHRELKAARLLGEWFDSTAVAAWLGGPHGELQNGSPARDHEPHNHALNGSA